MKKVINTLFAAAAGAMFPVAFFLVLVGTAHLFDEVSYTLVLITMALPAGSWLLYRKMGRHE